MDNGSRPLVLGNLFRRKEKYLASVEYWVFLPTDKAPEQDAVMTRMVAQNPHSKNGKAPIGPSEGILFSDVRLHVSVALRGKNPHAFRPDLFHEQVEPDSEVLTALAHSQAFVRLRFLSEEPPKDNRYLRFLPHMADAVAELGGATAIYDAAAKRLLLPEELHRMLDEFDDAASPDFHLNISWHRTLAGGYAQTSGLTKVGVSELKTAETRTDQQVIIMEVLEQAAKELWETKSLPENMTVSCFDDSFNLEIKREKNPPHTVHVSRIHSGQ